MNKKYLHFCYTIPGTGRYGERRTTFLTARIIFSILWEYLALESEIFLNPSHARKHKRKLYKN